MHTDICRVVEGLEWAVYNITNTPDRAPKPVINVKLGGRTNPALNDAFDLAYNAGVLIVVAAGNEDQAVSEKSPASEPSMITVGAVNNSNERWSGAGVYGSGSNYGPGVDIFAPGVNVLTVDKDGSKIAITGTSAAALHVAGIALLLKAKEGFDTPQNTTAQVPKLARKGVVKDAHGSPNLLAYLGEQSGFVWPQDG